MILDWDWNWQLGVDIEFSSVPKVAIFFFLISQFLLGTSISDCAITPLVNILSTSLVKI
jgi:hypothetical protein